jgi:hypothetical protein
MLRPAEPVDRLTHDADPPAELCAVADGARV